MSNDNDVLLRSLYEKCKNPVNSGPKCNNRSSNFHPSCAKLLRKLKLINENVGVNKTIWWFILLRAVKDTMKKVTRYKMLDSIDTNRFFTKR